jgi:hypothetical protein
MDSVQRSSSAPHCFKVAIARVQLNQVKSRRTKYMRLLDQEIPMVRSVANLACLYQSGSGICRHPTAANERMDFSSPGLALNYELAVA